MAEPAAPPNKKKRQRMILIGAVGAGLLLLLYLRSRSSASTSTTPNATSAADLQNAFAQGQQSAGSPSTFADNGANAAALGDALTQGLSQINSSFQQWETTPPSWYTPPSSTGNGTTTPAAAPPPAPGPTVVVNVSPTGSGVGTGTKSAPSTQGVSQPKVGSKAGPHGAIVAPSGHNKPPPKKNYTVVGTGKGGWMYVPKPGTPAYHK